MKTTYLVLAVIGTVYPLTQFYLFLSITRFNMDQILSHFFAYRLSSLIAGNIFVIAIVVVIFILYEARRTKIKYAWLSFIALVVAGVSSALPLFLYLREVSRQGNT
jgi:hypothetical protein